MGKGRRMKKQGPPEPIPESRFNHLKRKGGLPIEEPELVEGSSKKRNTSKGGSGKEEHRRVKAMNSRNQTTLQHEELLKKDVKNGTSIAKKQLGGTKPAENLSPVPSDSDEDMNDGYGASELERKGDDERSVSESEKLGDEFWGEDGDSVYVSDEHQRKEAFVFSEDEDDTEEDLEERLTAANIEGLSQKLDRKLAEDAAENEAEMRQDALVTNIDGDKPHVLDNDEEGDDLSKTKSLLAPDLQMLRTRITETIRVLDDFSNLAEEGRSRTEYTSQLLKDFCGYYGYSEYLADKLMNLFSPREAFAFFEANETPRPVVIRVNTLRSHRRDLAQALINRGVTLEPVKWTKVGLQIFESNVPLGATPEYLAGHYILQAASSFLPVIALAPQENERILDMASAPGGKATHMAAAMKNTGSIFANDPSKQRAKALVGNVHRLGARNVVVTNYDAREFPRVIGGFDRVLLDAPCSGTGVIAKDPSVKTNRDELDFTRLPNLQRMLLLAAIDSVDHSSKTGGYLVYSTCSVTIEENEQVVAYALNRRPNVKLVDTGLPIGKEGFTSHGGKKFHPSLKLTRRYYPHTFNMDGFFVAKFQKTGPTRPNAVLANGTSKKSGNDGSNRTLDEDVVIDKTPIGVSEDDDDGVGKQKDEFAGFTEEEDEELIERARRRALRRKGLNPKANLSKARAKRAKLDVKK